MEQPKENEGRVLRNSFGEVVAMVSKHAGVMEYNEETLAILKVLLRTSVQELNSIYKNREDTSFFPTTVQTTHQETTKETMLMPEKFINIKMI